MDEDFTTDSARQPDDRPRGVLKAKLSDIDLDSKLVIFYRPRRNAPMTPLEKSIPREAAMVFCDRIRSALADKSSQSYVITGGQEAAYKMIFAWIDECVQMGSIEKFPDISEDGDNPFQATIDVIMAGKQLGVPEGSLTYYLKKRLNGCARRNLMSFDQVREFYNVASEVHGLDLKDVACASVFNAWWDARLDESVNPELMEELYDMRQEIPALDEDLHSAFDVRKAEVEKKWAEKKAKRAAERAEQASGGGGGQHDNSFSNDTHAGTGWDNSGDVAVANGWDTQNANASYGTSYSWEKPGVAAGEEQADTTFDTHAVDSWADEMNEPMQDPPHVAPSIRW